jgi:CRP-like cAMP-binding protein
VTTSVNVDWANDGGNPMRDPGNANDALAAWENCFLAELPRELRDLMLRDAPVVTLPAGHAIYRAHDSPRFALLHRGLARVKAVSPNGREATLRYASSGQILGLPSVISNGSPVGADAVTECVVSMLNVTLVRRLAQTNATMAWLFARQVSNICFEVIDSLAVNLFAPVRQRVSRHLLDLARRRHDGLIVEVEQQELADAIGSVREVVARTLRALKDEGLIERVPEGIRLLKPDLLHEISEGRATSDR